MTANGTLQERARHWLDTRIMTTEPCIERLAGIRNDAVRVDAQASVLAEMRGEVEVWRYLLSLVPE